MSLRSFTGHIAILFALTSIVGCQQVTLDEEEVDLVLENLATYFSLLKEKNHTAINSLGNELQNTLPFSPQLIKTHKDLREINEKLDLVNDLLMEFPAFQQDYKPISEKVSTSQEHLDQIKESLNSFTDIINSYSAKVSSELLKEQEVLIDYLQSSKPIGVIQIVLASYLVKSQLIVGRLFDDLIAASKESNAKINFAKPYFGLELVPESNLVFAGDSLRFKLITFVYFKANPDSITFSHEGQGFTFGSDYAKFEKEIPLCGTLPISNEFQITSNYRLWLHGHSEFVMDQIDIKTEVRRVCE